MLGNMEFLSRKKRYEKVHKELYQPFFDVMNDIQSEAYHFSLFINDEGNEAVVINKIYNLQKKIFRVEINENNEYYIDSLFNDFRDKMLINLEKFRADIY